MESPQSVYSVPKIREKFPTIENNKLEKEMAEIIRSRCQMEPLNFKGEIRYNNGKLYYKSVLIRLKNSSHHEIQNLNR